MAGTIIIAGAAHGCLLKVDGGWYETSHVVAYDPRPWGWELRCHTQLRAQVMEVKAHLGLRKVRHWRRDAHRPDMQTGPYCSLCKKGKLVLSHRYLLIILCCRLAVSESVWDNFQGLQCCVECQKGQGFPGPGSFPTK